MMEQLPKKCQISIYTQFIFKDFLSQFRLFFNFKMTQTFAQSLKKSNSKLCNENHSYFIRYSICRQQDGTVTLSGHEFPYPYLTFDNDQYLGFMIDLLDSLEYRAYQPGVLLANELDECEEVLFVQQGKYNIGYQINNKVYYRKQLGKYSIMGGFQIMFNQRFQFLYKCCSLIKGLSIRKERFINITN